VDDATVGTRQQLLASVIARTDTTLLLASKWHVVIKDIVLIDPDLINQMSFTRIER
jgi:hypothetical protein